MMTAVSTLLTFWPPLPPDRAVDISTSESGMSISMVSSISGVTSMEAKEVCRLPAESKGEMRTRR